MHLHVAAALGSGLLVASTALSSLGSGSWLTATIPVPVGVVLAASGLILLPTGDLISLVAKWLAHFEPPERKRPPDHDSQRHRSQNRSPPPVDDHRHAETTPTTENTPEK